MFVILTGHVKLYKENQQKIQTDQRVLGPGQVLGDEEFKAGVNYGEYAEAVGNVTVLVIDLNMYDEIIQANIKKVAGLVDGLAEKLQELADMSEIQKFEIALTALSEVLYEEFVRAGNPVFMLSMNPEELAVKIGVSLEFLHQIMHELRDLDVIDVRGWQIIVLDEESLRDIAGME